MCSEFRKMKKRELQELLNSFSDGSGYGDPEARKNAELRLQLHLASEQQKTSSRLNLLTFFLVVLGLLNIMILAFQVLRK